MAELAAAKRVDSAREVGKAFQILAVFEVCTAHGRRKAQYFGLLIRAEMRNGHVEPLHYLFEDLAAAIEAVFAGVDEQARCKQFVAKARCGRLIGRGGAERGGSGHRIHQALPGAAGRCASSKFAVFCAMRSLLIMSGAEYRSRKCRPTLYGVAFL